MGRVLGVVYRAISAQLIQKAGFTRKTAQTGAVTLIQRFGSALNLNVHSHMLFLGTILLWQIILIESALEMGCKRIRI